MMYCPKCGTENPDNNFKCTQCGDILHPTAPPVLIATDDTLGGMIPTKNGPALGAYYLGIFSIIPFLGIALGVAALILGIKGLRRVREHPEVKGKVHAWVGVITGGVFALLYLILIVIIVASTSRS